MHDFCECFNWKFKILGSEFPDLRSFSFGEVPHVGEAANDQ